METKPYNLQSPEQIAKDYGGNKQKIAEAMQMGIVDPTAGTLAGMFIDRMRSAQMQEQAPQQTVAEQVFAPPQPAPAAAPPAPMGGTPAGLGATPEAAQMAQQMPPMPPQEAPVGMAAGGMFEAPYMKDGGLSELPIPDGMFDENRDGSYAGGGLVAFAGGGTTLDEFRRAIIAQESGGRFGIPNAQGSGAMGLGQIMPDTARAIAKRLGLPYRPDLLAGKNKEAQEYQIALTNEATREAWDYGKGDLSKASAYYYAGPDKAQWGPKTRQYQSDIARRLGMNAAPGGAPSASDAPTAPWGGTLESKIPGAFKFAEEYYGKNMPAMKNEGINALAEEARRVLAPEEQKKRRDEDKWATLAEIGFGIAGSSSPYLLQAVGAAASAALPGARAAKKEREAEKRQAYRDLAEAEGITYKQAMDKANYVREVAKDRYEILDRDITRLADQQKTVFTQAEETKRTGMQTESSERVAQKNADSYRDYSKQQAEQLKRQAALKAPEEARARAADNPEYRAARANDDIKEMERILKKLANAYYFEVTGENLPSATPPKGGNGAAPAQSGKKPWERSYKE
jgi:hypothetical protein